MMIYDVGLVLFQPQIVIGTGLRNPDGVSVDLPVRGRLRSLHASIQRNDGHYYINAFPRAISETNVNGTIVSQPRQLNDQDQVVLGSGALVLTFNQPETASGSAVLDFEKSSSSLLNLPCGYGANRIALFDKELFIGPSPANHLVIRRLPCRRLRFHWVGDLLHVQVEKGSWNDGSEMNNSVRPLFLPDELSIAPSAPAQNAPADDPVIRALFGSALGIPSTGSLSLTVRDPFFSPRNGGRPWNQLLILTACGSFFTG
jgi:hypothetical protein